MNVDIHFTGRQFEKQKYNGIYRGRNDVAISLSQPMLHQAIANQPAVDEDENRIAIQLLDFGLRDESVQAHLPGIGGHDLLPLFFLAPPGWRLRQANVLE